MFSRAKNDPDESRPNVNIDPVSMAHPGTLPVINKKAVEHMVRIGLAVNGTVANFTEFDRKNYFYPDIPKGYQISQYKHPIVKGGSLAGVLLTRVHLEEDTGTSKHEDGGSLIDFNRAGVPLMELVTEPVIHSPQQAAQFGRELQLLLQYLDASDAQMEKGELRIEINLSLMETDMSLDEVKALYHSDRDRYMSLLGTKTEVKNINSFKAAEKAAHYEIERMSALIRAGRGDEIVQETRGWDDARGITISQRSKENAADYRYFPDPDLPKLYLHELFDLESMKQALPELPASKRDRYRAAYGISEEAIEIFVNHHELAHVFEQVAEALSSADMYHTASNYVTSDLMGILKEDKGARIPDIASFVELMKMIEAKELNSRGAKDILRILAIQGGSPQDLAQSLGLIQNNDPEALRGLVTQIITDNPSVVQKFKDGDHNVLKFFVGQVMKETKGSANPELTESLFKELLNA
ncbi:MAG: Asp-tRNA(Asn)/Glu-tRNA(Gln) amidotransferase subunit GatB [Candidatus Pacebacteria bacterium]|nr:Asp-tRNA(Asn)/Glu-tRNA(Gln) amidotransferase subunit GatB [Candidatus Paceibacterota bacterium]